MAKSENTDNQFESELFLSKANELMEKHQINNLYLGIFEHIGDQVFLFGKSGIPSWKFNLLCAVANYFGARVIKSKSFKGFTADLVGRQSACITIELMFPYLLKKITKQAQKLRDEGYGDKLQTLKVRVSNSFYFRIVEIIISRQKAAEVDKSTGNELVIVDEIEQYVNMKFGKLDKVKSRGKTISRASEEAAKNIGLNLQASKGEEQLGLNEPLK